MGRITEENHRRLETAESYEEAALEGMDELCFAEELSRLITQKGVSVQSMVEAGGGSKSYINKLRNFKTTDSHPTRPAVLAIALALNASEEETNRLLKAARYQELYSRDSLDARIIWGMRRGLSGEEIREMLARRNMGGGLLRLE